MTLTKAGPVGGSWGQQPSLCCDTDQDRDCCRGLKEKGELGGIVRGVNSLVSAFQEDSGTVCKNNLFSLAVVN